MAKLPLVQNPTDFLENFIQTTAQAKNRIWLQTMIYETGPEILKLEQALLAAAKNWTLDIRLSIDAVSKKYVHGHPHLLPQYDHSTRLHHHQVHSTTSNSLHLLKNAGVKIFTQHHPSGNFFPLLGRHHLKLYIIDDTAWVGGVNLTDGSLTNLDFLVKFNQPEIVKSLISIYENMCLNRLNTNISQKLTSHFTLLLDSGKFLDSIIYQQAIAMVQKAQQSILFVSQFYPDGSLLSSIIRKARQGVPTTILTSHRNSEVFHHPLYLSPYIISKIRLLNIPNIHIIHSSGHVHAKYLSIDGRESLFGSHNFTLTTEMLGTKEIAIHSTDPSLIKQFRSFFQFKNINLLYCSNLRYITPCR